MSRVGALMRPTQSIRPQPCKSLAAFAAALLLSACSTSNLLPSSALAPETTATAEYNGPQSELQRATMYWGDEYAKKPTELQPALNFARNLKAMGEKQKALSVLQQASAFHDGNPELASEYGRLALELDQVNVADRLLTLADNPSTPDWRVVSARGTVLAKRGKYAEAIPYYQRALQLSANQPSVLNNLAMAQAMMGDAATAEGTLRMAASQEGATPKVRENLALVLDLQGRTEEAKQMAALAKQQNGPVILAPPRADAGTALAALKPSAIDKPENSASSDVWQTEVAAAAPAPAQ